VKEGVFKECETVVLLGQNGTGKTTFIKLLAGKITPDKIVGDDEEKNSLPQLLVSYKPQEVDFKFKCTVRHLFHKKINAAFCDPVFITDVVKPMKLESIIDQELELLSGGEAQRVALVLTLGKPADLYLIDEPSAFLDAEQRVIASKVIRRFVTHNKKTAFVVEHDFTMATYMADKIVVYEGEPGVDCVANSPEPMISGMNRFLGNLGVTFRRDATNFRPRINKLNSSRDREQKQSGTYFHHQC